MSVILRDRFKADPEAFWMTVSSLHAMAKDPECNHRLSEYAWYSIWTAILVDLAADETALESISANGDEHHDNPSSTSTRSTDEAEPREFRLPDISLLGMISTFRRGRARIALHERNITKFRIPIILEIKPEVGPEVGLEFGLDLRRAQSEVADQAKYLFAAYEQNVVIGIAAVGLAFRYAIFRCKRGSPSTASELRDPDYIDNLDNSEEWSPRETFGKRHFSSIFKAIVQIAFEEVLDLPFVENLPEPRAGDSDSEDAPLKAQHKGRKGKTSIMNDKVHEAGPSKTRK
ncbi:hypothetical protein PC9H_005933 [Pleurotus ostreatus]|uniref:Uncharacterized protein n=1 Tax=Pleurotus ostreatus TaxID=5322 RepID=A0A8H7DSE7_PLEOS|nr:uncharacterized protein PC9H_005933 [Pleurotus ostreatus]KAF7430231.1 hypothetical protein PC9H_005933 [Pleurotus ostreatus]